MIIKLHLNYQVCEIKALFTSSVNHLLMFTQWLRSAGSRAFSLGIFIYLFLKLRPGLHLAYTHRRKVE